MKRALRVRRLIDGRLYERPVSGGGLLTTDEVVRLLCISRRQVFYLVTKGVLHPCRRARNLRFRVTIASLLGQLDQQLAHAGASANAGLTTPQIFSEIRSTVTGLIAHEFYGLDDLEDLGDPGDPEDPDDDPDDSADDEFLR